VKLAASEIADPQLRPGQILHDGDGLAHLVFSLSHRFEDPSVLIGSAMGEIEADDVDARFDELPDAPWAAAGGTEGGNNGGSSIPVAGCFRNFHRGTRFVAPI